MTTEDGLEESGDFVTFGPINLAPETEVVMALDRGMSWKWELRLAVFELWGGDADMAVVVENAGRILEGGEEGSENGVRGGRIGGLRVGFEVG